MQTNSGIYKIENKTNNKIYIGSTVNFKKRWQKHKALLRHNKHPNAHLQAAWNNYGEESFVFSIIEYCPYKLLLNKEQYYIDVLNPLYNQTKIAGKIEMTEERRKRVSDSVNKAYKEGRINKAVKEIHQYDLKGNYIASYISVNEAAVKTNTDASNISAAANNRANIAGGYVWRFYKVNKLNVWFNKRGYPLTKEPYRKKNKVIAVYKDNEILEFHNTKEAAKSLGCTMNQLYKALTINRLLFKKYKVEYV